MTPVEFLIAAVAVIWLLRNAAVDTAFAVRGKASPRLQARLAAARGGRYGMRQYFADSMSDFWRGMRERREARRAGLTPPPRPRGRIAGAFAGLRSRVTGWWDRASTRVDHRRQAEIIADQERLNTSPWQRFNDRMWGRDPSAWPGYQPPPGEEFNGRPVARPQTDDDTAAPPNQPAPPADGDTTSAPVAAPASDAPTTGRPQPATPNQPAPQARQESRSNHRRQYVTQPATIPAAETTGVISGTRQAQQIRLAVASLRESTPAAIEDLIRRVDQQEAAAAEMKMDPQTLAELAQAREALIALKTAVTGAGDEVDASIASVENAWRKHLPGVDFNEAVGGLADRRAYES